MFTLSCCLAALFGVRPEIRLGNRVLVRLETFIGGEQREPAGSLRLAERLIGGLDHRVQNVGGDRALAGLDLGGRDEAGAELDAMARGRARGLLQVDLAAED